MDALDVGAARSRACLALLRRVEQRPQVGGERLLRRPHDWDFGAEGRRGARRGLFAIEAMAYGKPVVGYIHEEAAARTADAYGVEVPIVRTTKKTLADDLRALVASGEERKTRGALGRAYVERVHDADKMADRLIDIYSRL